MKSDTHNKKLIIIGGSGHGKVVADIATKMNCWDEIAFLDDDDTLLSPLGLKVIGQTKDVSAYIGDCDVFVAIGNNKTRERILRQLEMTGANIPILIHPNAIIGTDVDLGMGTVIMAGAVINCSSHIGKGCIINTGTTIDHDNVIGDYVHISPGAHLAGTVTVGIGTWVGIGSTVTNNISIIGGCTIGAGATVVNNINAPGTYVGVPCKIVN